MDFSRINKVGHLSEFLPVIRLAELTVEKEYNVTNVRRVQTKWGVRIIIELENEFSCFLPVRFAKLFDEDDALLQQMISVVQEKKNLIMQYYGGQCHNIEFKEAQK